MSTPDESSPARFDAADREVASYRSVSSQAVAGLLAGLLSPLAMFASAFWLVPLAAVVLSGLALRRMATRRPDLVGRPAAVAGLMLGAVFLVAAPVDDMVYRSFIRRQAREFAAIWFDAVQNKEVYRSHYLTISPNKRRSLESKLPEFYARNDSSRMLLRQFINDATMRTLFALGKDAEFRFYETIGEERQEGFDTVKQIYAVTYADERKQPKTFFISLLMQRSVDTSTGRAGWTMVHVDGGLRPAGW
jgi:hypothetical protein